MIYRINKIPEFNLEARRHSVERLAINPKNLRGAFAIVAGGFENVKYVAPLDLVEIW